MKRPNSKGKIFIKESASQFPSRDCSGEFRLRMQPEGKIVLELSPKVFYLNFNVSAKLPKGVKKPKSSMWVYDPPMGKEKKKGG